MRLLNLANWRALDGLAGVLRSRRFRRLVAGVARSIAGRRYWNLSLCRDVSAAMNGRRRDRRRTDMRAGGQIRSEFAVGVAGVAVTSPLAMVAGVLCIAYWLVVGVMGIGAILGRALP